MNYDIIQHTDDDADDDEYIYRIDNAKEEYQSIENEDHEDKPLI